MKTTEIKGQNIGHITPVNNHPDLKIDEHKNGDKLLVPEPKTPVSINGQKINKPTPVQVGDTVTIAPGSKQEKVLAVHHPDQKIKGHHIGDLVKQSGLNLKEEQVLALAKEIESIELKKFKIISAVLGAILIFILVFITVIWSKTNNNYDKQKGFSKDIKKVEKNIKKVEKKVANKKDQNLLKPEDLTKLETELQEKIKILSQSISENTGELNEKITSLEKMKNEISILEKKISDYGSVEDQISEIENILNDSSLGQQINSLNIYQNLELKCNQDQCCLNSLSVMKKSAYTEYNGKSCPSGMSKNRLKCLNSLEWCE